MIYLDSKPHVHHESMILFAVDASKCSEPWLLWEFRLLGNNDWTRCTRMPTWYSCRDYRHKPEMFTCNGIEFPAPEKCAPNGGHCFAPNILNANRAYCFKWCGTFANFRMLERGLVHLTEAAANKHADALIAVTKPTEKG